MFQYVVKLPLHDFCIIQIQIKSNVIYKYKPKFDDYNSSITPMDNLAVRSNAALNQKCIFVLNRFFKYNYSLCDVTDIPLQMKF